MLERQVLRGGSSKLAAWIYRERSHFCLTYPLSFVAGLLHHLHGVWIIGIGTFLIVGPAVEYAIKPVGLPIWQRLGRFVFMLVVGIAGGLLGQWLGS